jgi:poly(hydroxyalkanoate) depolymerase family esterase
MGAALRDSGFLPRRFPESRMARSLSSLFFATARKMVRMQRVGWGLPAAVPRKRKKPAASPAVRVPRIKTEAGAGEAVGFVGAWRAHIYRTPALPGVWPVRLSYFVYVPPTLRKGCPMVVMLHGCEQGALDLARGTRMHKVADREGVLLVYPQQSVKGQSHRCWHWFQPDAAHGHAEADAIAGIIGDAAARHGADPTRIYIAGLSAGAAMAAMVALRHPEQIAAVGMHSGPVFDEARSIAEGLRVMRRGSQRSPHELADKLAQGGDEFPGMPAIILQGQRDSVVSPHNGAQLLQQFVAINGPVLGKSRDDFPDGIQNAAVPGRVFGAGTAREYVRHDWPSARGPAVSLCEVGSLGHAWSGGDGKIRFHSAAGPNAALLMWRFFKQHQRVPAAAAAA